MPCAVNHWNSLKILINILCNMILTCSFQRVLVEGNSMYYGLYLALWYLWHVSVFNIIKNLTCDHLSFTAGDEKWMNLAVWTLCGPNFTLNPNFVTQQSSDSRLTCFKYGNFNLLTYTLLDSLQHPWVSYIILKLHICGTSADPDNIILSSSYTAETHNMQ